MESAQERESNIIEKIVQNSFGTQCLTFVILIFQAIQLIFSWPNHNN